MVGKISVNQLKRNKSYKIGFQQYEHNNNIFCVQKGQRLWSVGTTYKLIAKINIENSTSSGKNMKGNNKVVSTENSKISKDYNKKLATAIVTLGNNKEKMKSFMWGFFDTWIEKVGHPSYGISSAFAKTTELNTYDKIDDSIEEEIQNMTASVDDFENITDIDKIAFKTVTIDNKDYVRIGPYQVTGIPSVGLKNLVVNDQNNNKINDAKIVRYYNNELTVIGVDKIKNEKNFYICIPKDAGITKVSGTLTTKKVKTQGVKATIYLLQSSYANWQNLVVTEGSTIPGGDGDNLDVKLPSIDIPGELTIIKKDSLNNETVGGATFVIFKYAKADNGSWYKKGDTYTQNKEEADDKNTTYVREYVCNHGSYYTYDRTNLDKAKENASYQFTTGNNDGKIELTCLKEGTYYAKEIKAPKGYKLIDGFFQLGGVKASQKATKQINNEPDTTKLDLIKVNEDDPSVKIPGVGFKFQHEKYGWMKQNNGKVEYTTNANEASMFYTDDKGNIPVEGAIVGNYTYYEDPNTLPYGYDITGKEQGNFTLESKEVNTITIANKQKWVKLSGFAWVDKVGAKDSDGKLKNGLFKVGTDGQPDGRDLLFDGIDVRVIDRRTGQIAKDKNGNELKTTTGVVDPAKRNDCYKIEDGGYNGHGEYLFEDVEIAQLENYYIEFEYDGLTYASDPIEPKIAPKINENRGSKAVEGEARTTFNAEFSSIEGTSLTEGKRIEAGGKVREDLTYDYDKENRRSTLNNDGQYSMEENSHITEENRGNFKITANTDNASYSIRNDFKYGQEEIPYINLGLYDRDQPDILLGKDIKNVQIDINKKGHTYDYDQRYDMNATTYEGDESFNVGVKFKEKYTGSYTRAIYKSDFEYEPQDKSRELKVYITYELILDQSNINLQARVNSITDYFDRKYTLEAVGSYLDEAGNIVKDTAMAYRDQEDGQLKGIITDDDIQPYNDAYNRVVIPCNTTIQGQGRTEATHVYVKFKIDKETVATMLKDKGVGEKADELLNNRAEITSYSIFDKNGNPYAGIDINSNPGNCDIDNFDTYENDTSSSPGLQLEVTEAREMTGNVFIDNPTVEQGQNVDGVMTGKVRQGDGEWKEGEANVEEVQVILKETSGSGVEDKIVQTTKDGFYLSNYIPGDYTLTYIWGGQEYQLNNEKKTITVQDYKGTIYPDPDRQNSEKWWYVERDENGNKKQVPRLTDAIDNYETRKKIDEQIAEANKDNHKENKNQITIHEMDSTTPTMGIGVEYDSPYTDFDGDKFKYRIDNIDFGIIERAKQDLVLTERIKTFKATLANGNVMADFEIGENGKMKGQTRSVTYMRPNGNISPSNGFVKLELDNELIQGSLLEIGYEIKARNNSELDYIPTEGNDALFYKYGITEGQELVTITPTGIIDYLDRGWSVDTENEKNQPYGWDIKAEDETKTNLVSEIVANREETETDIGDKTILYTEYLSMAKLQPNSSETVMLNASKQLTTTDEISLEDETEEVVVNKTGGSTLQTIPGNYIPGARAREEVTEVDDNMAETTIVTPATGENQNYIIPVMIGTIALIILGAGVIVIKKKVI